ncbi:MAG: TetR/AcrR family transcriptional regulator, partial [Coprobacillaceae bacterium]
MNKREIQKAKTKEKITKVAMEVYAKSGFATPTNVIAKEAGVSHGTIFNHFPTLEDLYIGTLESFNKTITLQMHNLSITSDSIKELLYKYLDVIEEYEAFYTRLISETNLLPIEVRFTLIEMQSGISHHFSTVVEKERALGTIKDIPLHMLFNTWLGLVHYYLQNSQSFAPNESVIKRYKKELVTNYLKL